LCGNNQIERTESLSTLVESKRLPIHHIETRFKFSILVVQLSHAIDQCKCALSDAVPQYQGGMRCLAGTLGLRLRPWMGFHLRVLFMGFLPRNTVAVTIVYILVVLCNEHTFIIFCNSFLFSPHLCLTHAAADFVKCALYCSVICFYKFCYIIFFHSGLDFYCIKLIFLLQWYSLK
jgi:hypothetical protein